MKIRQLTISILLFSILASLSAKAGDLSNKINIVFIGNSITHAYYMNEGNRPPSVAAFILGGYGLDVKFSNCGVSGSTTVDFLPAKNNLYKNVIEAANSLNEKDAQLVFSITLGTNDSAKKGPTGSPVSSSQYKKNMQCIIDSLVLRYPSCKIVLNCPTWYSPNTHNSAEYLQEGLDRLQTYFPQIHALVNENAQHVYLGDTEAFDFFKNNYLQYLNPESGNSGTFYLHPNEEGAEKLARFWAKGLKENLIKWGYNLNIEKVKVACVGNSITENSALVSEDKYPSILQRNIGDDYTVRNFGASGHTLLKNGDVPYWNSYKYREVLDWQPDVVIIKLGTNDTKTQNWDTHKGEFKQDYIDFINSFKNLSSKPKIYVCYPLPLYGGANNWLRANGDDIIVKEMMPILNEIAQEANSTVIDLHTPFVDHNNLVYDQVHPNTAGTTYMAYIIGKVLCPECSITLPEEPFVRLTKFDYTDKAESLSSSLSQSIDLSALTDNNANTTIDIDFDNETWFAVNLANTPNISAYSITVKTENPAEHPSDWEIQGSSDGQRWRKIDTQNKQTFLNIDTKVFQLSNSFSYKHFRLYIKATNGSSRLNIADWQLFGYSNDYKESLTSNNGTITSEHAGVNENGWVETIDKLIDGKFGTKYCVVGKKGGWIQYELPTAAIVNKYSITSADGSPNGRDPKEWKLQGSNNGSDWNELDVQKDEEFLVTNCMMEYTIPNQKAYKIYRLVIEKNRNESNDFQLSEWMLFEKKNDSSVASNKINCQIFSSEGKIWINSESEANYEIFNLLGHKISDGITKPGNFAVDIFSSGIYFVKVSNSNGSNIKKLTFNR